MEYGKRLAGREVERDVIRGQKSEIREQPLPFSLTSDFRPPISDFLLLPADKTT